MRFSTSITLSDKTCIHNGPQFAGTPAESKANAYWCPLGPLPGRAWLIMARADVEAIQDEETHTLVFRESGDRIGRTFGGFR